ncbi:MAG: hypothetical protein BWY99_00328 [Synergistetes bacterium ADurb.BinA166]|nr:MAG: hypothetical protein BWY99_00328 [Synergistetes bacterium ADurb.BinA166]
MISGTGHDWREVTEVTASKGRAILTLWVCGRCRRTLRLHEKKSPPSPARLMGVGSPDDLLRGREGPRYTCEEIQVLAVQES